MPCSDDRHFSVEHYENRLKAIAEEQTTMLNDSYTVEEVKKLYNQSKADMVVLTNEIATLRGMLCALCTETYNAGAFKSLADKATTNGDCLNIREWFKDHLQEDVNLLVKNGLPKKASKHEKDLFERLETIKKLKGLEYVSK